MLPKWFKEHLSFHRAERRGVLFLTAALLLLIGFNSYQHVFWDDRFQEIKLEFGPRIVAFSAKQDSIAEQRYRSRKPWLPQKVDYFKFDPNKLDSAGWVKLGFSPKQSASIINYRNAGAIFRKPQDVKKLFVVDDEKYEALQPFIQIDRSELEKPQKETKTYPKFEKREKPKPKPIIIELNAADTTALKKLYGIGSSFAKRIVKYRELLGGYISEEQLLEVYGMDTARYNPISENLTVDTTYRNRININTSDFKTLLRHPYLNKNQVRAIINYRKQHGHFKRVEDLKKIHLIDERDLKRLEYYLSVR